MKRWSKGDRRLFAVLVVVSFAVGFIVTYMDGDGDSAGPTQPTSRERSADSREQILDDPFVQTAEVAIGQGRLIAHLPRGGATLLLVLDDVAPSVRLSAVCDGELTSIGRIADRLYGLPGSTERNSVVLDGVRDCTTLTVDWAVDFADLPLNAAAPVAVVVAAQ